MSFSKFGLSASVLQGVHASGYESPTEIQQKALPIAVQGNDIIGCAPTGTGKTAAFVLPILTRLEASVRRERRPRALVLTPTRELAHQIEESVRTYGKFTTLRSVSVYGGVNIMQQHRALRDGTDIVIATPGRLLDHMQRRSIDLTGIEILVLDEADRMFDMGFIRDVRRIIAQVPARRQTLLFSATMSSEVRSLAASVQKNPRTVEVGEMNTPVDTVEQQFYAIPQQKKADLLVHILKNESIETMLVFSRTKHGADRIARRLGICGISSVAIHSNRSQSQRQEALDGFKQRRFKVLVATDLAARGIDVRGISHVVNYDTPVFAEDYIHRIGRTGRAEATGTALTFVSDEETRHVRRIEHLTGRRFSVQEYPGFSVPSLTPAATQRQPARFETGFGRFARNFSNRSRRLSGRRAWA